MTEERTNMNVLMVEPGKAPYTLIDFFGDDYLMIVDEFFFFFFLLLGFFF